MTVSDDTKQCPYCAEEIRSEAIKCKHCGEFLDDAKKPKPQTQKVVVKKQTSGATWGCLILILVFTAWCTSQILSPPRPRGRGTTASSTTSPQGSPQEGQGAIDQAAVDAVAPALNGTLGIVASDLRTKPNPGGDGTFVYVPKTRFSGVERLLVWVVVDGNAYALNGPSKEVTPDLQWPREAPTESWSQTGLDPYSAMADATAIVFEQ